MKQQGFRQHETAWSGVEYCDEPGAQRLKRAIQQYWKARGYEVEISLHNCGFVQAMRARRVDLRSDMVCGLPRRESERG